MQKTPSTSVLQSLLGVDFFFLLDCFNTGSPVSLQ